MKHVRDYQENGYAIVRGVFDAGEIAEIAREADRFKAEGMRHHATFRHQNILYLIDEDPQLGRILRFMQWPAYVSDILERYRVEPRLLEIVEPLIGNDLKQITNQIIWKPPGSARSGYAYHQDVRFRRPKSAFRNLATSYVQTVIAVDPHRPENGCLKLYPGSHALGDLQLGAAGSVLEAECEAQRLHACGLDPARVVDLILDPGDVAIWSPYAVHGSHRNRSNIDRRFYVNGYISAANSDRGEWAFRHGQPCALGEPQLVQYEDLYSRPEPHYVVGPPFPYKPD
jgi:ectoine hydroxylase-related dioxygenase (phytanoyl-CoA dioxygenase family)